MKSTITAKENLSILKIEGELNSVTSEELSRTVQPLLQGEIEVKQLQIDCRALTYVSSAGLRIFLMIQKAVKGRGGQVNITGLCPEVREVFDMTGFSALFTIC
jgi:anti-anti-sigma factor